MIKKIAEPSNTQHEHSKLEYYPIKSEFTNRLSRNLALATLLLIGIVSVRNEQLPTGAAVMTAVQETVGANWNENLGKISFVSTLFPDSVSVFFDTSTLSSLTAPCFGTLVHPWNEDEPYLGYQTENGRVYSAAAGQVMSLAHGINEERILRIRHEDGLETLYYHLEEAYVKEGDTVTENTCIGRGIANADVILEVRKNGISTNPAPWINNRSEGNE